MHVLHVGHIRVPLIFSAGSSSGEKGEREEREGRDELHYDPEIETVAEGDERHRLDSSLQAFIQPKNSEWKHVRSFRFW